jgi:hypothetical protein
LKETGSVSAESTDQAQSNAPQGKHCEGQNSEGKPCGSYALKGQTLCSAHSGLLDHKQAAKKSAEVRKARLEERPRSVKDALARRFERRADEIAKLLDRDIEREDSGSVRAWMVQVYGAPAQLVQTEAVDKAATDYTLAELEAMRAALVREQGVSTQLKSA